MSRLRRLCVSTSRLAYTYMYGTAAVCVWECVAVTEALVSVAVFPLRVSYVKNFASSNWTTIKPGEDGRGLVESQPQ